MGGIDERGDGAGCAQIEARNGAIASENMPDLYGEITLLRCRAFLFSDLDFRAWAREKPIVCRTSK